MNPEPTEREILELLGKRKETTELLSQNWVIQECSKEVVRLTEMIKRYQTLIELCKNPEVVQGIEIFFGKPK